MTILFTSASLRSRAPNMYSSRDCSSWMADYDIAGVDGDLLLSRHGALHRLFVSGSDRRSTARAARRWASMATRRIIAPNLKQMILGLVVDGSGSPLCTEMWPGNIADV